jgi:hypothetical protein
MKIQEKKLENMIEEEAMELEPSWVGSKAS